MSSLHDDYLAHAQAWFDQHQGIDEQLASDNAATIDRLTTEAAEALSLQKANSQQAIDSLIEQQEELEAALAALHAEFDAYVAAHPDTQRTLVGSSASRISGETSNAQAIARIEAALGPIQVARVYDEAGGAPKALQRAREAGLGKRGIALSFKYPPVDVAAGTYDAAIRTLATALRDEKGTYPVYLTYEHEADSKVQKGNYTAAQFKTAWGRVYDLVKAVDPTINMTLIVTGYQFDQRIGNFYTPAKVDVVAVDPYSYNADTDASVLINNFGMLAWFNANKVRWAVAETGQQSQDMTAIVTLVKSYQEFADLGAEFYCHFNAIVSDASGPVSFRIDDKPLAAEAFRNLKRG